jgi:DNA repair protein RadA/Sms
LAKEKTVFTCQKCGYQSPKWLGRCPDCTNWNCFVEEIISPSRGHLAELASRSAEAKIYDKIESAHINRITTAISEFDRVLGGGIIAGSLTLIGGEPGIGKSTLMLQVSEKLSCSLPGVLYISGEESEQQIKLRGERLGLKPKELYFLSETCLERIIQKIEQLKCQAAIIDSIQTVFSANYQSAPGSISQVREAATQLLFLSKRLAMPIFIIGHVTKDGSIAGPKSMEHIVDAVLYFEGERYYSHRILRAVKNRFGPANELGIFQMTDCGLRGVSNPSEMLLAERPKDAPGSVVLCSMEGTRPLLVELQALISPSSYATARRMSIGIDYNRVALLLSVLEKRMGFRLLGDDVFINVAGGITISEPAADLAVIASVASSYKNKPVDFYTAFFGEVGLTGEVRAINQAALRIKELASMGFRRAIIPAGNASVPHKKQTLEIKSVKSVKEALELLF